MVRTLNIALITYEFPPYSATGGIGSYMAHLSKLLTQKDHKVFIFSANPLAFDIEKIITDNCLHYLIPAKSNEEFRNVLPEVFKEFIGENKVDVIESPEVGACALEVKKMFPQIPLIVKMHTPGVLITKISQTYHPIFQKLRFVLGAVRRGKIDLGYWSKSDKKRLQNPEYEICKIADVLLSPSVALKKWAGSYWGLPAEKIKIVPNPYSIEDDLFLLPIENRPKIISFVGKLSILKGMIAFTKAIPAILSKNEGYKIVIVGRDEMENGESMKSFMEKSLSKFTDRIVYTGALTKQELKKNYAQSRVCIVPSLWENYPNVILEAMAAGSAVAASYKGGIPEIIKDGETGILFNPLKPRDIAEKVNDLIADDEMRFRIASKARVVLKDRTTNSNEVENILSVYEQFLIK